MSNPKFYTKKDTVWTNANGDNVPVKFVPKSDLEKEKLSERIFTNATKVEQLLLDLHKLMFDAILKIKEKVAAEFKATKEKDKDFGKGNFTFYNFDRSVKIEANMNDIVKWDNAMMTEALAMLNNYLNTTLTEANVLVKDLVTKAFSNAKGMIDTGKVFAILRYESQIKHKSFQSACEIMKKAQSIDKTKLYMRVWVKQTDGQYKNVNLNFSQITV